MFHKLPNGTQGLLEWYPNAKKGKKDDNGNSGESVETGNGNGEGLDVSAEDES